MATKSKAPPARHRRWPWASGAAIVVLAGAALVSVHHAGASRPVAGPSGPTGPSSRAVVPRPAISAVNPAPGATGVGFRAPVIVTMTIPMAKDGPHPVLSPAVAGTWTRRGTRVFVFHPSANFVPATLESVSFPGGADGLRGADGRVLAKTVASHFTVADATTLRLQQLLAELNYLPVAFAPGSGPAPLSRASSALSGEAADPSEIVLAPRPGSFTWRFARIPAQLGATWQPGLWNLATKGAVMAFEYNHQLPVDGEPGPKVWGALLDAVAARQVTTAPYNYLLVTETLPETLFVWSDGNVVYQSSANTGVTGASTALGTFPVYLRYTSTTMTGTNPDGSHYTDPDIPWVSYFNGSDAVHGFVRSTYGFPQSDGCVELPIANAATVFPYDTYGTLVTVTTGDLAAELSGSAGSVAPTTTLPPTTTTPTTVPSATTTTLPPTTTTPTTVPSTTTTVPSTTAPLPTTTLASESTPTS